MTDGRTKGKEERKKGRKEERRRTHGREEEKKDGQTDERRTFEVLEDMKFPLLSIFDGGGLRGDSVPSLLQQSFAHVCAKVANTYSFQCLHHEIRYH